jgi:hypothetical protein
MKQVATATIFGAVGFLLGWLTRPLVEGRGVSLAFEEVIQHAFASEDQLLRAAAHQTMTHVAMFGLACAILGFVVARLSSNL